MPEFDPDNKDHQAIKRSVERVRDSGKLSREEKKKLAEELNKPVWNLGALAKFLQR